MAVDMPVLPSMDPHSCPYYEPGRAIGRNGLALALLSRKRGFSQLESSEGASSSSQQSQQTFLDGDSPCSSVVCARTLPSAGERGPDQSLPCTSQAHPLQGGLHPCVKRQRCADGARTAAVEQQQINHALHDARVRGLQVPTLQTAGAAPAGSSPAELQRLRAQQMRRQASWPHFLSPHSARDPSTGLPASFPSRTSSSHPVTAQPPGSLLSANYATPAGRRAVAAHPLAPKIRHSTCPPACEPKAFDSGGDRLLQEIMSSLCSTAGPESLSRQLYHKSKPVHQYASQAWQTSQHAVLPASGASTALPAAVSCQMLAQPLPSSIPCSSLPELLQHNQQWSTADVLQQQQQQVLLGSAPSHPAPLWPEQQAQLHLLCDQLLSKTLAPSVTAADALPQPGATIPAHRASRAMSGAKLTLQQQNMAACKMQWPRALPTAHGATGLITHWSCSLALQHTDSVFLSLHLWSRIRDKVSGHTSGQRRGMLAACLWVAAKHEECRRGIPPASRIAAVAGLTAKHMNVLELAVLAALAWSPLAGWDDGTHSKGQLVSPHNPIGMIQPAEIFYL